MPKNKSKLDNIIPIMLGLLVLGIALYVLIAHSYTVAAHWYNYKSIDEKMDVLNARLKAVDKDVAWVTKKDCIQPTTKFAIGQLFCVIESRANYDLRKEEEIMTLVDKFRPVILNSKESFKIVDNNSLSIYPDARFRIPSDVALPVYDKGTTKGLSLLTQYNTRTCGVFFELNQLSEKNSQASLDIYTRCSFDASHPYYPLKKS